MAQQLQQGPAREAETTVRMLERVPDARSSFARGGQEGGRQYTAVRTDLEEVLREA